MTKIPKTKIWDERNTTYEDVEGPADDWLELGLEVSRSLEVFWFPDAPWVSVLPDINDDSKAQRAVKGVNKSHM